MRARRLALFAALLTTAACSAIAGLDGDFTATPPDATTGDDAATKTDAAQVQHDGQVAPEDAPFTPIDAGQDGTTQPPPDADADVADTFVPPVDACSIPSDAGTATGMTETHTSCAASTDWFFCWDFRDTDVAPKWGWDDDTMTAGTGSVLAVEGTPAAMPRELHVTIASGAAAGTSASLTNKDWNSKNGPSIDPFQFPPGSTTELSFTFNLKSAARKADIIAFTFTGGAIGVSVYPDPCGGPPHIALLDDDARGGAIINPDTWHHGRIVIERRSDGSWRTQTFIDAKLIGTRDPAASASVPTFLDNGLLTVGLFNLGAGGGAELFMDDLFFKAL